MASCHYTISPFTFKSLTYVRWRLGNETIRHAEVERSPLLTWCTAVNLDAKRRTPFRVHAGDPLRNAAGPPSEGNARQCNRPDRILTLLYFIIIMIFFTTSTTTTSSSLSGRGLACCVRVGKNRKAVLFSPLSPPSCRRVYIPLFIFYFVAVDGGRGWIAEIRGTKKRELFSSHWSWTRIESPAPRSACFALRGVVRSRSRRIPKEHCVQQTNSSGISLFSLQQKDEKRKKKEQNTYKGNRRLFFLSLSLSLSPTAFLPSLVSSVSQLRLKHRRRCQARRLLPGDILFFIRGFPQFRSDLFLIPKQISGQSSRHYLPLSSLIFFSSFKRKKIRLQLPLCQAPYGRCVPRCLCLCVSRKKGPRNTSAVTSVSSSVAAETRASSTIRTRRKSLLDSVFRSWCDFQILFLRNIKRREIVKNKVNWSFFRLDLAPYHARKDKLPSKLAPLSFDSSLFFSFIWKWLNSLRLEFRNWISVDLKRGIEFHSCGWR